MISDEAKFAEELVGLSLGNLTSNCRKPAKVISKFEVEFD